tara:strand:- start:31 stop:561 length:531 start_codon:yes stop_codon:yes gene_type:complete
MKIFFYIILFNLVFGNYSVIQAESQIEYFGSHPMHGFSGSSSLITLLSNCNNSNNECNLHFTLPIISLNSGNDNRDSNMLNYLEAFIYPDIILDIENFIIREYKEELILANISIHGISQEIKIPLTVVETLTDNYKVNSVFSILLDEFNVSLPKLLFLPINNEIKINVQLLIKESN